MGGSSSKSEVKQEDKVKVVNKSSLDILTKNLNDTIVNTTVKNVKECSQQIVNTQRFVVERVRAGGDVKIDSKQLQKGAVDFKCVQDDDVRNQIAVKLVNQIVSQVAQNTDTNIQKYFKAVADSKAEGGGLWGKSDSHSDIKQKSDTEIITKISRNFTNIVENRVAVNFSVENISRCLQTVANSQELVVRDVTAGRNFTATNNQEQAISIFKNCVQKQKVSQKVMSDLLQVFDIQVKDDTKSASSSSFDGNAISRAYTGFFPNFGGALEGMLKALGPIGGSLVSASIILSSLIMVVFVVFMMMRGRNKTNIDEYT